MIDTIDNILLWITEHHEYAPLLCMSRQRLVGLRKHLREGTLSEQNKEELLSRLSDRIAALRVADVAAGTVSPMARNIAHRVRQVHKVRNAYTLPAVVRDKHGKFFTELTLLRMVQNQEQFKDLNLERVCRTFKRGDMPSEAIVREVLNRKGWTMFEPRYRMPSVWEVE